MYMSFSVFLSHQRTAFTVLRHHRTLLHMTIQRQPTHDEEYSPGQLQFWGRWGWLMVGTACNGGHQLQPPVGAFGAGVDKMEDKTTLPATAHFAPFACLWPPGT